MRMKRFECSLCQKSVTERDAVLCKNCDLIYYCSEECCLKNKDEHDEWCTDVQMYMITKSDYDDETSSMEIDGSGTDEETMLTLSRTLLMTLFSSTHKPHFKSVTNWTEYFEARSLKINPILCDILQWVMTTYCIINEYFKEFGVKENLRIHIIGAEREVKVIETFKELSNLLVDLKIEMVFIGANVDGSDDGKTHKSDCVRLIAKRGIYHEVLSLEKPDLVIGFNAGLPAYLSWIPTLKYLKENDIPSYFTEYCWRGYHITSLRLSILEGITVSQGSINKFKTFVRIPDNSTKIPQFSNHIIFKLRFLK